MKILIGDSPARLIIVQILFHVKAVILWLPKNQIEYNGLLEQSQDHLGVITPNIKIYYPINYGYIEGIIAPDDEEQDVYILG